MSVSLKNSKRKKASSAVLTEAPAVTVHKVLRQNGLYPSDVCGCAEVEISGGSGLGILRGEPYERPDALLFKGRRRRDFIGVVRFNSERLRATKNKWVLEVYGRQNIRLAKQLSREITRITRVPVAVILSSEEQEREVRFTDFA